MEGGCVCISQGTSWGNEEQSPGRLLRCCETLPFVLGLDIDHFPFELGNSMDDL